MTMATNGKQIEELSDDEKQRELRLRYSGAILVLVQNELRVAASRLCATYPLSSSDYFVGLAREAFAEVAAGVCDEARGSRPETRKG